MTEIDHYAKAAQLLRAASEHHADGDMESAAVLTQLGQAYATLALSSPASSDNEEHAGVYHAVTAWTGMSPGGRTAVRAVSEELYNALGFLSTATTNSRSSSS